MERRPEHYIAAHPYAMRCSTQPRRGILITLDGPRLFVRIVAGDLIEHRSLENWPRS